MADARDYFAEERTYLAWIRTGLALMTFGFVVARFEDYLAKIELGPATSARPGRFSVSAGAAFIVVGVLMNVLSTYRHLRVIDELNRGEFVGRRSRAAVFLSIFIAAIGAAMAVRLLFV